MAKLIRNRVTERDIRDWMSLHGFEGGSATLDSVELYAIKRPGWKQLFRFEGKARKSSHDDENHPKKEIWGVVLDDERKPAGQRTEVAIFYSPEEQKKQLDRLAEGMLLPKRNTDRAGGSLPIIAIGLIVLLIFFSIAMAKRFL